MRKKFLAGAAILALLMNSPQVSADDDIVIFGEEFEDETSPPAPKKIQKPEPIKELPPPPEEKPAPPPKPEIVEPQDKPPTQPQQIEKPKEEPPPVEPQKIEDTKPIEQPQTIEEPKPIEPTVEPLPPSEVEQPFKSTEISGRQEKIDEPIIIVPPTPTQPEPSQPIIRERSERNYSTPQNSQPQKKLKTLKPRFIKIAVDDTYTYYLDKTSVQWKKMPYSTSEYIADVWVRMIERQPQNLDDNMASYGEDNFNAEISLAQEQGYQYSPEDLKVLQSQGYVLEHYYLRPKTNQIQFLCELEVFGRPQNAINERSYDYKNWENLVPGSVESIIYAATIKIIGKGKASEKGHMTFFDMLDEYARISL